ncbi:IclR family transcriptional regulator [Micromonospora sp. LZ34]
MNQIARSVGGDSVKSALRALKILDLLTQHESAMTFVEIGDALGYPKSSLHGLLRTLVETGWAQFDPASRRYSLGIRTLEAGNVYMRSLGLVERARPFMERVRDQIDETVQMAILDGRHNVYVAKVDGRQALTLASEVGRRLPAHATGLGKVLLAGLSAAELDARLGSDRLERFTAHTVVDRVDLDRILADVRRLRYAADEEEYSLGVRCVAVPVLDFTGRTVAGMSVSVPSIRFDEEQRDRALMLLRAAARDLSALLGYRPDGTTADASPVGTPATNNLEGDR